MLYVRNCRKNTVTAVDSSGDDDSGFSEYFSSCSLKALKRRKYIMGDIMIVGGYKSDKKFVSS